MAVACIDMEGVLIPEVWPHIAIHTGIGELARTTREEPDYVKLVDTRIRHLWRAGVTMTQLQTLVRLLKPLPGAKEFLQAVSRQFRVVLVSDAFEELVASFLADLPACEVRCHHLLCDADGLPETASYARREGKHEVVAEFSALGLSTLAVGDAFNDLSMIRLATRGFLFRPSVITRACAPDVEVFTDYDELLDAVKQGIGATG